MAYKVTSKHRKSCVMFDTKYSLKYDKGNIVKKHPGTLGIFCFKTKQDARKFSCTLPIVKVKGKKPQKIPSQIPDFYVEDIDTFYRCENAVLIYPPPGTILYDEVKVLE